MVRNAQIFLLWRFLPSGRAVHPSQRYKSKCTTCTEDCCRVLSVFGKLITRVIGRLWRYLTCFGCVPRMFKRIFPTFGRSSFLLENATVTIQRGMTRLLCSLPSVFMEPFTGLFSSGEVMCFLGKRDAARETLISLLSGTSLPSIGDLLLFGEQIKGANTDETAHCRKVLFEYYRSFRGGAAATPETLGLPKNPVGTTPNRVLSKGHPSSRLVGLATENAAVKDNIHITKLFVAWSLFRVKTYSFLSLLFIAVIRVAAEC